MDFIKQWELPASLRLANRAVIWSASRTDVRPVEAVTAWADMVFLSRGSERGDGTRLRGCPPGAVPADQFGRNDDLVVAAATALDLLEQ